MGIKAKKSPEPLGRGGKKQKKKDRAQTVMGLLGQKGKKYQGGPPEKKKLKGLGSLRKKLNMLMTNKIAAVRCGGVENGGLGGRGSGQKQGGIPLCGGETWTGN